MSVFIAALLVLLAAVIATVIFMEQGHADSHLARQTAGRPPHVRRAEHAPAAPGEHRGRHPPIRLILLLFPATTSSSSASRRGQTNNGSTPAARSRIYVGLILLRYLHGCSSIRGRGDNLKKVGAYIPASGRAR
jgi:hypothetical protein